MRIQILACAAVWLLAWLAARTDAALSDQLPSSSSSSVVTAPSPLVNPLSRPKPPRSPRPIPPGLAPGPAPSRRPMNVTFRKPPAKWLFNDETYFGDGTAYSDPVNNNGSTFACSFRYLNSKFSTYFAAINKLQWEDGAACGRCVKARCVDSRCPVQNKDLVVQIVDLCPECQKGDVDFSYPAYKELTGMWPHRLDITWEWTSCAEDITGTMGFYPKEGTHYFWQAFFLSNFRYPITEVKLNGEVLERSPYQFFIHGGRMPEGDMTLEVTADSGAVATVKMSNITDPQDLEVQFPLELSPLQSGARKIVGKGGWFRGYMAAAVLLFFLP